MVSIVTRDLFERMLPNRDRFYTYEAFVTAANAFPDFGNTGDMTTRKREIAAFFAQTSQETTEYRFVTEHTRSDNREPHAQWPPAPGKQYYGRGPIQLSWNYNYGQAGRDLGVDLLNNPDQVATNPVTSFKTALWFWMTPQPPKPSCHDVIIGSWNPSASDRAAGRVPGFGMTTNIINGGLECGQVSNIQQGRIEFFRRYCQMFGISPGYNLDCGNQRSYGY